MTKLLLDIDGVLITTPIWKADQMDSDGYSKFNENCVVNLNKLLLTHKFEIWLSSTRRTVKRLSEFNQIFKNRGIEEPISGFLPEYSECKTRKEELVKFICEHKLTDFLIIDDDKSLNGLNEEYKERLILTELHKGFDAEKLDLAIEILKGT